MWFARNNVPWPGECSWAARAIVARIGISKLFPAMFARANQLPSCLKLAPSALLNSEFSHRVRVQNVSQLSHKQNSQLGQTYRLQLSHTKKVGANKKLPG